MRVSAVLLTRGDRSEDLAAAIGSIRVQSGSAEIVLVANGCSMTRPDGVDVFVELEQNVGVPAGRNRGWEAASGEVVFFLDDDARLDDPGIFGSLIDDFSREPELVAVSCRVVDEEGSSQRHHVPRLRVGDPSRSSVVATFLGGASALRRSALVEVGGFPEDFFYAHEELDVAWALADRGGVIRYRGDLVVHHPRVRVGRHPETLYRTARNRVWVARRRLPFPLAVIHVLVRLVLSLSLVRSRADLGALVRGTRDGLRVRPAPAAKIGWRTVWRLTRMGRPPIL